MIQLHGQQGILGRDRPKDLPLVSFSTYRPTISSNPLHNATFFYLRFTLTMNPFSSILSCLTAKLNSKRGASGKSSPATSCSSSYMFNRPYQIPSYCKEDEDPLQERDSNRLSAWAPPSSWHCSPSFETQTDPVSRTDSSDTTSSVHTDATNVDQYIIEAADETDPTRRAKLLDVAFDKHVLDTSVNHRIPSACGTKISSGSCSSIRDMLDCVDRNRQDGLQGGEEELQSFAKSGAAALRALLGGSSTGGGASVPRSGKVLSREEIGHRRELGEALSKLYLDYSPCQ